MTMKGSTPRNKRWVVLLILRPWPLGHPRSKTDQISLYLAMNQDLCMGAWLPSDFKAE